MNKLMAKIKTMDYKQFALQHGEKIGLGVIGLVALVCLGMTHWASDYSGTPEEMGDAVGELCAGQFRFSGVHGGDCVVEGAVFGVGEVAGQKVIDVCDVA